MVAAPAASRGPARWMASAGTKATGIPRSAATGSARHCATKSAALAAELPPMTASGRAASTASSDTVGVSSGAPANTFTPPHRAITSLMKCPPLTVMNGRCQIS